MSNNKSCFSSFCRIGRKKPEPEVAKFADTSEIFSESQQSTVVQIDFRGDAGSASKTTNYNEESQPNSKNANNADAQFCATCASKLTTARTEANSANAKTAHSYADPFAFLQTRNTALTPQKSKDTISLNSSQGGSDIPSVTVHDSTMESKEGTPEVQAKEEPSTLVVQDADASKAQEDLSKAEPSAVDPNQGIEDLDGLKEVMDTKYTQAQLTKEKKNLSKIDKKIGAQSGKLQKSRNSLSSLSDDSKRSKEMKKIAKTAATIGVLEVDREAQNYKVEKLQEMVNDQQALVSVVKRNSVQLSSAPKPTSE